jgi:hypothetical protein
MESLILVDFEKFRNLRYFYCKGLHKNANNTEFSFRCCYWNYLNYKGEWLSMDVYNDTFIEFFKYSDELHRTTLFNEIVFDIDKKEYIDEVFSLEKSIESSKKIVLKICDILESNNIQYSIYYSGNKGFHIHLLHDILNVQNIDLKELSKLRSTNLYLFFKLFRKYYLKDIGINDKFLDNNFIDKAKIFQIKTMIRCEGGKHNKSNRFKTYLTKQELDQYDYNKFTSFSKINLSYLTEINKLSVESSDFIFEKIKEEFKEAEKPQTLIKRYHISSSKLRIQIQGLLNAPLKDNRNEVLMALCCEFINTKSDIDSIDILKNWNNNNYKQYEDKHLKYYLHYCKKYKPYTRIRLNDLLDKVDTILDLSIYKSQEVKN